MTWVWCGAAGCAVACSWWVSRPDDHVLLTARLATGRSAAVRPHPTLLLPIAGLAVMALPSVTAQVAAGALVAAVAFAHVLRRRAVRRREARAFRAETASFLRAWSGELRAGQNPITSARAAAIEGAAWDPLRVAVAADVPDALHAIGDRPGGEGLSDAAAAWRVADLAGAPLAEVLDRVAATVQDAVDVDREVAVEAAPARATASLMAALPMVGLLLGTTLGANPVHVLTSTGLGVGCLVLGFALAAAGVWWIERLVAGVET